MDENEEKPNKAVLDTVCVVIALIAVLAALGFVLTIWGVTRQLTMH